MVYEAGRPEKMNDELKQFAYGLLEKNINIKAPTIQKRMRKYLIEKGIDEETVDNVLLPGQSAIGKYLKEKRPEILARQKRPLPIDTPWSIGSCLEYDILTENIPLLLDIKSILSIPSEKHPEIILTNRMARWINLLWKGIIEITKPLPNEDEKDLLKRRVENVTRIALEYTFKERIAQFTGSLFADTSDLDKAFFVDGKQPDEIIKKLILDDINQLKNYLKNKRTVENE
jgi:hypothetical protein